MIKMGEIICRIPSNGIKPEILYCTEPEGLKLDVWTVTAAWATALLTAGLLIAAVWAARVAVGTLRQMKQDSISQSRPYVYGQLVPGLAGPGMWDLIIKNAGQSAARNLTAKLSQWPEEDDVVTDALRLMFSTPQTLPPGTQLRTFWSMQATENSKLVDPKTGAVSTREGIRHPTTITFTYEGDGESIGTYQDTYDLDSNRIGLTPAASTGPEPPTNLDANEKAIYKILARIVGQIGELRR